MKISRQLYEKIKEHLENTKVRINTYCPNCHQNHQVEVVLNDYYDFKDGLKHAQEAFPYLKPGEREMLISGICPTCWDKIFKEEEEE